MEGLNASGLASDFLSLLIFLDPLLEVFRLNQEDFKGQTLVGVAFAIFLFLLSRKGQSQRAPCHAKSRWLRFAATVALSESCSQSPLKRPAVRGEGPANKLYTGERSETATLNMPVVIVEMWEGRTEEQKERLIEGIARTFGDIGVKPEWLNIIIHDVPKSNWGVGDKQASKM